MPLKMKRTALIQEGLRRLLRKRRQLPWEIKARILSEFSHKMMLSGYWEKFRLEVIEAAVTLYDLKCQKADQGIEPLHRLRSFKRKERRNKKLLTPYIWHKPHDAPLFVPATLQSSEVANKHLVRMGMKLKFIETAGRKLGSVLVNLNLTGCWWDDCFLCECEARGRPKGDGEVRLPPDYKGSQGGHREEQGGEELPGQAHRALPPRQGPRSEE